MTTQRSSHLWIECPDCEGCGGWYGCESCGAVLSRDEPPASPLCKACEPMRACVQSGGHEWGNLHTNPPGKWFLGCVRDCGAKTPVEVAWQRYENDYAYVTVHYGTVHTAQGGR